MVKPGGKLSLQSHHHRSEHWVVVKGTLEVTKGEETELLSENQSTYIPIGKPHRLANPGKIPAFLIEVQSGAYLDEDDIVRFEDIYRPRPARIARPARVPSRSMAGRARQTGRRISSQPEPGPRRLRSRVRREQRSPRA